MHMAVKVLAILTGILMAGVGIFLMIINPQQAGTLQEGFHVPILSLEFTQTVEQLEAFLDVPHPLQLKHQLSTANLYDYAFMALYSLFAFFCGWLMYLETRIKVIFLCLGPILIALGADAMENIYIGSITTLTEYSGSAPLLKQLHFYTWIKWGSISGLMLFFSVYFLQGIWWKKLLGLILLANFGLFSAAFFLEGTWIEPMSYSVFASYLALLIFAFLWSPVTTHRELVLGQ
jgi:hypothetical protein